MFKILEDLMRSGRYRRLNQWLHDPVHYNNIKSKKTMHSVFYNYCYELLRKKNPKVRYDETKHQIVETDTEKKDVSITDKVPTNPTESEKKEIAKLKDQVST